MSYVGRTKKTKKKVFQVFRTRGSTIFATLYHPTEGTVFCMLPAASSTKITVMTHVVRNGMWLLIEVATHQSHKKYHFGVKEHY